MSETEIQEQQPAPDFTLPAIGSEEIVKDGQVHLGGLKGHNVVLYFYPKDDTPGCTKEACGFRDANHVLQQRGVVVLGISVDSIKSHQKFIDKFSLPFPLLADTEKTVAEQYHVWKEKSMYGKTYMGVDRQTFLIDKEGIVRKVWRKVKPDDHANEVLEAVEALHL
ncbi:putative peroxiredoxin bcp [Dictyobacter vulcani]|uniref:thioredoxin-dependent peroxiredoxin n=1 Tax=Dictyobacter vulcani TaxID=2607529 RepID=A0A5J4KI53_9CHLR|nr:thioredoxin-dependent thiol peroxidase [Dictyobacter vulcani]GER86147.1 putative peroxiredoxin bcp [Dictyobacter vulcani]